MSALSFIGGMAIGSIIATVYLSSEYNKCRELLNETREKLNNYRKSNKMLVEMVSKLRMEVIDNEQS